VALLEAMRRRRRLLDRARALYAQIARAARTPDFYAVLGVPDTIDGRFDLIVLHAHLVLRRLKAAGGQGRALGQALFDTMFADMDEALRELGVGDLSVGRKIREMTEAYYGRALAYEEALQSPGDKALLEAALTRNVYQGMAPGTAALATLADYVCALEAALAASGDDAVLADSVTWPAIQPLVSAQGV
jgi:cytochrome b pre-mRNA-processing protein 3